MESQGPFRGGDRFLKYEIRSLIGSGGYAFVYHAYDPHLERDVALKIIPGRGEAGRDLVRRAKREAQFQLQLEHPNIVRLYDAGATDELMAYLVMEKLVGRTLRDALTHSGPLSPREGLTIGLQVARALAAAHARRLIHRDVKPENTFIVAENTVKVLDFGIAKVLGAPGQTTDKDRLHGSLLYMSPEQLRGLAVTEKSDLFALGTMLYESLHRHPTLGEGPSTFREVGWRQIAVMPRPLHEVAPEVPLEVSRFVQRAIMKDPADRYASMLEFIDRAQKLLGRLAEDRTARGARAPARDLSQSSEARSLTAFGLLVDCWPGTAVDGSDTERQATLPFATTADSYAPAGERDGHLGPQPRSLHASTQGLSLPAATHTVPPPPGAPRLRVPKLSRVTWLFVPLLFVVVFAVAYRAIGQSVAGQPPTTRAGVPQPAIRSARTASRAPDPELQSPQVAEAAPANRGADPGPASEPGASRAAGGAETVHRRSEVSQEHAGRSRSQRAKRGSQLTGAKNPARRLSPSSAPGASAVPAADVAPPAGSSVQELPDWWSPDDPITLPSSGLDDEP